DCLQLWDAACRDQSRMGAILIANRSPMENFSYQSRRGRTATSRVGRRYFSNRCGALEQCFLLARAAWANDLFPARTSVDVENERRFWRSLFVRHIRQPIENAIHLGL